MPGERSRVSDKVRMYDVRASYCFRLRYPTAGFGEEFGSNPHEQIRVDVVDIVELAVERGTRDPSAAHDGRNVDSFRLAFSDEGRNGGDDEFSRLGARSSFASHAIQYMKPIRSLADGEFRVLVNGAPR